MECSMEDLPKKYGYKDWDDVHEKYIARWKLLNKYGVYTEEDLKKFMKEYQLDIGFFTTPIPKDMKK